MPIRAPMKRSLPCCFWENKLNMMEVEAMHSWRLCMCHDILYFNKTSSDGYTFYSVRQEKIMDEIDEEARLLRAQGPKTGGNWKGTEGQKLRPLCWTLVCTDFGLKEADMVFLQLTACSTRLTLEGAIYQHITSSSAFFCSHRPPWGLCMVLWAGSAYLCMYIIENVLCLIFQSLPTPHYQVLI